MPYPRIAASGLSLVLGLAGSAGVIAQPANVAPAAAGAAAAPGGATPQLPAALLATLRKTGVPLKDFGVHVRAVDSPAPTMSLNAEQPFLLASTAKVVTSMAALNLLGAGYQWRTQAHSASPVRDGRMAGDLVIVGGSMGLTPAELQRWFKQMRGEGLQQIAGRIVLDRFSLLYETQPARAVPVAAAPVPSPGPTPRATPNPADYNRGASVVVVQPTKGELAAISLVPAMPGVVIVNEMLMGGMTAAVCGARVRWGDAPARNGLLPLVVSGRWIAECGRQEVAFVKPPTEGGAGLSASTRSPAAAPAAAADLPRATRQRELPGDAGAAAAANGLSTTEMVASLWAGAGGQVRGGVVEAAAAPSGKGRAPTPTPTARAARAWTSQNVASMPEVIREMNKTSNNDAARDLLLALGTPAAPPAARLGAAQGRVSAWLREQGLADGDITLDEGSGQSRLERGRPRAMVQLLLNQWRARDAQVFIDSLPVAGVDGTLANRMRKGPADGRAFMKTGTLSDTRALAGYVLGASGKVYAVALVVSHARAAGATRALDAVVEWLAKNG